MRLSLMVSRDYNTALNWNKNAEGFFFCFLCWFWCKKSVYIILLTFPCRCWQILTRLLFVKLLHFLSDQLTNVLIYLFIAGGGIFYSGIVKKTGSIVPSHQGQVTRTWGQYPDNINTRVPRRANTESKEFNFYWPQILRSVLEYQCFSK